MFVREEECAYVFPEELRPLNPHICDSLRDLLSDESSRNYFYVVKQQEGALHVLSYERAKILEEVFPCNGKELRGCEEKSNVCEDDTVVDTVDEASHF